MLRDCYKIVIIYGSRSGLSDLQLNDGCVTAPRRQQEPVVCADEADFSHVTAVQLPLTALRLCDKTETTRSRSTQKSTDLRRTPVFPGSGSRTPGSG